MPRPRHPWWGGLDSLPQCPPPALCWARFPRWARAQHPQPQAKRSRRAASGLQFYPQTCCVTLGEPCTLSEPCSLCNGDGLLVSIEWGDENRQPGSSRFSAPGCYIYDLSYRVRGPGMPPLPDSGWLYISLPGASHSPEASVRTYGWGLELEKEVAERTGWWGQFSHSSLPPWAAGGRRGPRAVPVEPFPASHWAVILTEGISLLCCLWACLSLSFPL